MDVTKPYEFIGFGAMDVTKSEPNQGFLGSERSAVALIIPALVRTCGKRLAVASSDAVATMRPSGENSAWSTLCYAILLPGRKSAFRARFWPDCDRESTEIGPLAGPISVISR